MRLLLRALASILLIGVFLVLITGIGKALKGLWFGPGKSEQVAVIDLAGIIYSSSHFTREINELLEDNSVKAIVVRINSPGGLVGPSQELFRSIEKADKKIPVVVSMGSLAASGGYYAAIGGRKIFSNPGTLTASIGVIMEFANTEKLYQWAKVDRYSLKAGKFKDTGSPLRAMTPEDRKLLEGMLQDIHGQFRKDVASKRKLSPEALATATDGRVMTGSQAKEIGLVDELGGLDEAISEAKKIAKVSDTTYVSYPESKEGLLKKLILGDHDAKWDHVVSSLIEKIPSIDSSLPGFRLWLIAPLR